MPALETFDWFTKEISSLGKKEILRFLEEQRKYLLEMRNENERRRMVDNVIADVKTILE